MQNLKIESKSSIYLIPEVNFDAQTGECWIQGESYLENTTEFYDNLKIWLKEYINNIGKSIILNLKLIYMNTSSQRALLEMFWVLRDYHQKGGKVVLNWYYPDGDIDQVMEAEDYSNDIEMDFNLISY